MNPLTPSERRSKKAFMVCLALAFAVALVHDLGERDLLSKQGISNAAQHTYFDIKQKSRQPSYLLDEYHAPAEATVTVTVDASPENQRPISPLIYGMTLAPPTYLTDLHLGTNRWGGTAAERYNWKQGQAVNNGRPDGFTNRSALFAAPAKTEPTVSDVPASDTFLVQSEAAGTPATVLTVPTLGWVARSGNHVASTGVPLSGGPPLPLMDASGPSWGYDPTRNRTLTSVGSVSRQVFAQPEQVAQDTWITHMVQIFGPAGGSKTGKSRFYSVGDDYDLWDSVHTDVHPAQMGYDDFVATFLDYARAVKDADGSAQIVGPAPSGWRGVLFSPLDKGRDDFQTHAEQKAHNDTPFLAYFLEQVKKHDDETRTGRSLDVVGLGFTPQGSGLTQNDAAGGTVQTSETRARRLRATRALWDTDYVDESWINEPVYLLPRVKAWIDQNYPGTKIGLSSWNMGGEGDISGGLAALDVLGICGRENVFMASYGGPLPPKNDPTYLAFKLMRNPDDKLHGFGDVYIPAQSADDGRVSSYAALDSQSGDTTLLFINKMTRTTVTVLARGVPVWGGTPQAWRLTGFDQKLTSATVSRTPGDALVAKMPPISALLIRLPHETAPVAPAPTKANKP